jgi:hypothetical protein
MKLKKRYAAEGAEVPYLLDAGDGQMAEGAMRGSVAEEIVRCAKSVSGGGPEGHEVVVNGRMLFPASVFEDGEPARAAGKKAAPARTAKQGGK